MDRATVWGFQEHGGAWTQQNNVCVVTGVSDTALGPGVYVISLGPEILYVGQSKRGLVRTQDGFTLAMTQSAAYKWRERPQLVGQPLVVSFYDMTHRDPCWDNEGNRKALEADVAAAVRIRTGNWPTLLTRIDVYGSVTRHFTFITSVDAIMDHLTRRGLVPPPAQLG